MDKGAHSPLSFLKSQAPRVALQRALCHHSPSALAVVQEGEMALNHAAYEFRGNAYRKLADLDAWTKLVHEPALEPDLPILDPHHHVWDDERGRYLMHELAEDTGSGHNIVATVFIEAGSMYRAAGLEEMKPVGEVEFVNGIAAMSASGRYGKTRH